MLPYCILYIELKRNYQRSNYVSVYEKSSVYENKKKATAIRTRFLR